MSGQRARSAVTVDHRSVHPNVAGIPWWGAVLSAVVATAVGFAFDAGSGGGQLTGAFSTLYVLGCLIGVLAVAQNSLFTAVIQPPLVLFVAVPGAYFLMHSSEIQGLKDVLINCGYPLIERFPLMFFTSAVVLLIGLGRWYFARTHPATADAESGEARPRRRSGLLAKVLALVASRSAAGAEDDAEPAQRRAADRRRTRDRRPATNRTARSATADRPAASRSRHSRAAETEIIEPVVDERPRRRRPRPDDQSSDEPRRRPRTSSREPREPRESRESRQRGESRAPRDGSRERRDRTPRERREREREPLAREPRESRSRRSPYERDDRYERSQPYERRRSRLDDPSDTYRDPLEAYRSPASSSHHPVSRVRYRGEESDDRPRRRAPREADADRWEFDI